MDSSKKQHIIKRNIHIRSIFKNIDYYENRLSKIIDFRSYNNYISRLNDKLRYFSELERIKIVKSILKNH